MQAAPQILLYRGIHNKQPAVFIDFQFRWDIVERMKKISGATNILDDNFKNFKNPLDDLL